MRSVIIRLIIIAVFILLGSYLYFRPHSTPIDTASVTIEHVSLYHYFSGPLSGGMEETVSIINSYSENDKILANALDHEAFKSLILSNLAKGDPPELFTYWAGVKTQDLVSKGYLEPLDDIWKSHGFNDRLAESLVNTASIYNGRKYFLPLDRHLVGFFYNAALFEDLGLKPPENCQTRGRRRSCWGNSSRFQKHTYSNPGQHQPGTYRRRAQGKDQKAAAQLGKSLHQGEVADRAAADLRQGGRPHKGDDDFAGYHSGIRLLRSPWRQCVDGVRLWQQRLAC